MTAKKDLKRRVRARQEKTGESYVEARRQVQAQKPAESVPFVEMIDLSEAGAAAGLRCRVAIFPKLAARVDAARVLVQLRAALEATDGDPAMARMRAAVLRGEQPPLQLGRDVLVDAKRFLARVRVGIGGPSAGGRMLALQVGSEMVVCVLYLTPAVLGVVGRAPLLILTTAEGMIADPLTGLDGVP